MKKHWKKGLSGVLLCLVLSLCTLHAAAQDPLHTAYLSGYPDGSIRPDQSLTREELAQILWRMLPEQKQQEFATQKSCFADVSAQRWSYRAITAMAQIGIVPGSADGCFYPEQPVTGPDLAMVMTRIANTKSGTDSFSQLAKSWQEAEISFSEGFGWVMGLRDEVFDADAALTRAETACIFNRLLNRTPAQLDNLQIGMPIFTDNADSSCWYFLDLQEAAVSHTFEITQDGEIWTGLG